MDADNRLGLRDRKQVITALQVAVMRGELRAAIFGLAEAELLDHRAHRAVENGDPLGEELAKLLIGWRVRYCVHSKSILLFLRFPCQAVPLGKARIERPIHLHEPLSHPGAIQRFPLRSQDLLDISHVFSTKKHHFEH